MKKENGRPIHPYACIRADDEIGLGHEVGSQFSLFADARKAQRDTAPGLELLPKVALNPIDQSSGNPYAAIGNENESVELASGISIAVFRGETRRIFSLYIPTVERRQLRPHQREFITRNSSRSAQVRAKILKELAKYDLANLGHISAQFNRERDPFTEAKLKNIEAHAEE